jgi:hypothetical protein
VLLESSHLTTLQLGAGSQQGKIGGNSEAANAQVGLFCLGNWVFSHVTPPPEGKFIFL